MSQEMSTEQMDLGEAPRLMISKVVCENFKSYAGTKVLGPFHKCFSSVVGPNGSGKSNMIDAMLFVFGYRAAKIRSKKVSVLIHKSDQHRDFRHCSVSVHFQKILDLPDSDQFSVVPDSEFVVSRTAYADNSSIYQLNGKRMQFKEIAALLRESGIDLDHNRFLILQGEVEQIAMMKPRGQNEGDEGMLEFLEDVIGSSRLKAPIEELGKKVDLLNDARGDKVNRVKAVEHEKNDLEAAKTEAEEYLSLQADIAKKQCILYQKYIMECGRIERQAESKKDELEEQIVPLKDQLKLLKEEAKEREKDLNKGIKLHEKLLEEIEGCRTALTSCEQRDVSARQELKNAKANLKKIEKTLEKEKEKLKDLEEAPDKCQKNIEEATDQIEVLESRKEIEEKKLSEVLSSLRTATQGLQEEKEGYELELISLNQRVNEAKAKVDMAQAELDLFNERSSLLQSQLDEAREKLTRTKDQMKASKEGVSRLNRDIPLRKKQVADSEEELKSLSTAEGKLTQQVKHLRSQAEEGKLSLDAFKSRSKVLQSLLQQRDSGELPGVCGRLGDLGTIDQRYDVAISTACAALDHIVVDTMETAVKCVSYLKHNGLGSATFIGLDKVDHLRGVADKGVQVSEDVPRLYDLVKPKDDKYRPAFYFALRNTLVASDLEQATRIGMKGRIRHRVVTLSGQLIDSSGTMSGGGNRVSKGRMSSKASSDVSPQQVEEFKKRLQDNERALTDCCERRTLTEDRLNQLKRDVSEMEKELRKYEVDAQLLVDQEEAIRNRIVELQDQISHVKVDTTALRGLRNGLEKCQAEYDQASSEASVVKGKVQRVHEKIMEVGGSKVQSQQNKVDGITEEMDALQKRITKANVTCKTSQRNAKKCRDKVASQEKEVDGTQQNIEHLRQELKNLEDQALQLLEKHKQLVNKAKEDESVLNSEKSEVEKCNDNEVHIESNMMDLCHEQDRYIAKIKENQQKIKHFEGQIAKLDLGEDHPQPDEEELKTVDTKNKEYEITILEERLKQMTPNMAAIEEYRRKEEVYLQRLGELNALTAERDAARKDFDDLRKQRLDEFMAGFGVITSKLKEMYQMITLGGDAELELVDSLDPFSEGIVFSVRPPKKSWKNISNLSGGEKTLSSLALVFALHHYKPSPLYVMDEIDAALDYRNVSIIAHYIKERTKNAQFIIISLRNNMFELADHLVGIYKTHDSTKVVVINPQRLSPGAPLKERNSASELEQH